MWLNINKWCFIIMFFVLFQVSYDIFCVSINYQLRLPREMQIQQKFYAVNIYYYAE